MKNLILFISLVLFSVSDLFSYPIDGYETTGIRRLLYLQMVKNGELPGTLPKDGGQLRH
jgi:hypothetical protein